MVAAADWVAQGERYLAARDLAQATACYARAVELDPGISIVWGRLGKLHLALRQFDHAAAAFTRALALEPRAPELHTQLAYALREQNQAEAAVDACNRALALAPGDLHAAFAEALMLPPIYADGGDLGAWRQRFTAGLERLHARLPLWLHHPQHILDLEWTNFLLAYQGENDAALQRRYSDLVAALLGAAAPRLQKPVEREIRGDGRIRVGFVSAFFHASTVGDYFGHWIADLPRDRFHVETFHIGHLADERTRTMREASDAFVHIPDRCDRIAEAIRARRLDVAVLPDVGMIAKSVLLANLRLARVQCAAWGHPVSTGSAFVDGYVSCAAMEPPDAAAHYTEALVPLPGIGVRYRPPAAAASLRRSDLGLSDAHRIYLCPQSLCKIHPDNDALLLDIVARDEQALLLFFEGQSQGQTEAFVRRLTRALRERDVPPRQQIRFLPRMDRASFLGVMQVADVMIDTLRWSGGNTTLDALASALPVVTMEGAFMRGRQTAAMLRILGLDELIAADRDAYVARALRVTGDPGYRSALSLRIRDALPKLLDRPEPAAALANALEQAAKASASR